MVNSPAELSNELVKFEKRLALKRIRQRDITCFSPTTCKHDFPPAVIPVKVQIDCRFYMPLLFGRFIVTRTLSTTFAHPASLTTKTSRLSLSDFLLRQRVLSLWRDIVRALNKIPKESSTREEMRTFAREEFERNKEVKDTTKIRYLVSTGRTQFDEMSRGFAGL